MSDAPPLPPSVSSSLARDFVGPLLLGAIINIWLYGAFLMQVQTYFRHAQNDHKWMKWMVASIFVIGTLNSAVSAYTAYDYAVTDFGRPDKILVASRVFGIMVVTTAITGSIVQAFFGLRIKWLTGNTWIGWGIIVAAIIQLLCAIGTITAGYILKRFPEFQKFRAIVIVWLVLAPVTDLVISGSLVHFLRSSRTGFAATDDILTKLTRLTIQTGLITAICALLNLIVYLAFNNNWNFLLNMALAKLYANCLMSSLNARTQWAQNLHNSQGVMRNWTEQSNMSHPISIKVTTSRGVLVDHDDFEMEVPPNIYTNPSSRRHNIHSNTPVPVGGPMRGSGVGGKVNDIRQGSPSPVPQDSKKKTMDDGLSFDSLNEMEDGSRVAYQRE